MARLLVLGNTNLETTLRVQAFPIPYESAAFVPFGIDNAVSGVGYNLAKALSILGDEVVLASITGRDTTAALIRQQLLKDGISDRFVVGLVERTPLSLVAYDESGTRGIFTDMKDVMEQAYPPALFDEALSGVDVVLFTQAAYCRPLVAVARAAGRLAATDLQLISDFDDPYKRPFLEGSQVVFMSGEALPEPPGEWAARLLDRYPGVEVVGIGSGVKGAYLAARENNVSVHVPAVVTRSVVNTGGAGDALFACFMHYYARTRDPEESMRKSVVFASYKIGESGSSRGFLNEAPLEALYFSLADY